MRKKFSIARFSTYLIMGLSLLGTWGGYNYNNYSYSEEVANTAISEEVVVIEESVEAIETEQQVLRQVQHIYSKEDRGNKSRFSALMEESPVASAAPAPENPIVDELESRIEELENEKIALEESKTSIINEIREFTSIFKLNANNPMINIVVLPLLLYGGKKLLDILFKYLDKKVFA